MAASGAPARGPLQLLVSVGLGRAAGLGDEGQRGAGRAGSSGPRATSSARPGRSRAMRLQVASAACTCMRGGNLFGEQFDQQLGVKGERNEEEKRKGRGKAKKKKHGQAFNGETVVLRRKKKKKMPPSFSTQASAHILLRSRMRPM